MRCYPPVKVKAQSFLNSKVVVLPNQSMSLQEIIKRFVRKEALPIEKSGFYAEGFGDVEKIAKEDITSIHERGNVLRNKHRQYEALLKDMEAKKKAEADKLEADRLGGPVLTKTPDMAKSAGGIQGGGESPPETKK